MTGRTNSIMDTDEMILTVSLPGVLFNEITVDCKGEYVVISCSK